MLVNEFEKKIIITFEQYEKLSDFFKNFKTRNVVQINYYYDTYNEKLRKNNITCRIRQKDDTLVGTIKKHITNDDRSVEQNFEVKSLPYIMKIDETDVSLKGQLTTFRSIYTVSESIDLILDKNIYLGTVDYEIEVEYNDGYEREADRFINNLIEIIGKQASCEQRISKSERFFEKLNSLDVL